MYKALLPFILVCFFAINSFSNSLPPINGDDEPSTVLFDLNSCFSSNSEPGSANDYSEFTPIISNTSDCANLSIVGDHLYRNNPLENMHSCSPGIDGSIAMCVGISESCEYVPGDDSAIRFDIEVSPISDNPVTVSELRFWENAPESFNWINGPEGPNDYPTKYAIRVLINGITVYEMDNIDTENEWNEEIHDFSDIEAFNITETTILNFELVPYCAIGNGADVKAWDVDNIKLTASCLPLEGGEIVLEDESTQTELCLRDEEDSLLDVIITNNLGDSSSWIIVNDSETILSISSNPPFDFNDFITGNYFIYHISYYGTITGLEEGDLLNDIEGCFDLSNPISVDVNKVDGGEISVNDLTEIDLCISDENTNQIILDISNSEGLQQIFIITDIDGNIIDFTDNPEIDLSLINESSFLIWSASSSDPISVSVGMQIETLEGCVDLSNSVLINQQIVNGGELIFANNSEEIEVCTGDGFTDSLDIVFTNEIGEVFYLIITNTSNDTIVDIKDNLEFDAESLSNGTYNVYLLAANGTIEGLEIGNTLEDLSGCFDLSNTLIINSLFTNGGELELENGETEISICAGDGISDAFNVILSNNEGENNVWLITDTFGVILNIPDSPPFDLEEAGLGICQIWNLSYAGTLSGLEIDNNVSDIIGCYNLSNPITVTREEANGGEIIFADGTDSQEVCSGDGEPDLLDIIVSNNSGSNSGWIITDEEGKILDLPTQPPFNFEGAQSGICLIWHISFSDGIMGLEIDSNAFNLSGCFDLSNSIEVVRTFVNGGILETEDGFTELIICADDGESDSFDVSLTNNVGSNNSWVITDNNGIIQEIPAGPPFDFEGELAGASLIWNISYEDGLTGLEIGLNLNNVEGCSDLSNPITVTKLIGDNCDIVLCEAEGGNITLDNNETQTTICVGDGEPDSINVILTGEIGENSGWIITDLDANILALPTAPPFDLEGAEPGTCLIWHISYDNGLTGLEINSNAIDIDGCFDLSNPITVLRLSGDDCNEINCDADGGDISFIDNTFETIICVGDGVSDSIDVVLNNNFGTFSQWLITDISGNILDLPSSLPIDFENAEPGNCLIYHLSHEDNISGLAIDSSVNNFGGCFDLSNPIIVIRLSGADCDNIDCDAAGGLITYNGMTEVEICANDNISDTLLIDIEGNIGNNFSWVITDVNLNIIDLPDTNLIDFENADDGICLIWNISYDDGLEGLEIGANGLNLNGCFDLSNPITVTKFSGTDCFQIGCEVQGGTIAFADTSISQFLACVGNEESDIVDISLSSASGDSSQWVITDDNLNILALPLNPPFDFEDADPGICFIWHISYDTIIGLEEGLNAGDLEGCFDLSNNLTVIRKDANGGELTFSNDSLVINICVQDGIPDSIDVNLSNIVGDSSQWIITDDLGNILALPDTFPIDFESNDTGICMIYNISYNYELENLMVGNNIDNITGCFDLSNSIQLNRFAGDDCDDGFTGGPKQGLDFVISPNPSTSEITIELMNNNYPTHIIYIYDSQGRVIGTYENRTDNQLRVNISDFNDGLYFVRINSGNQTKTKKFMKL